MAAGEVQEIEFAWQHDCPFNELTSRHEGVNVDWETPAVGVDEELVLSRFELVTPEGLELDPETVAAELEADPSVVEVDTSDAPLYSCLLEREMITMSPELLAECVAVNIVEHDGIEEWRVLTPSSRVEEFLFERLEGREDATFELRRKVSIGAFGEDQAAVRSRLTEKQREAILTGFRAGYFEYPRGASAEEVGETLGITASSYISRIRRGEHRLVEAVFEDELTE